MDFRLSKLSKLLRLQQELFAGMDDIPMTAFGNIPMTVFDNDTMDNASRDGNVDVEDLDTESDSEDYFKDEVWNTDEPSDGDPKRQGNKAVNKSDLYMDDLKKLADMRTAKKEIELKIIEKEDAKAEALAEAENSISLNESNASDDTITEKEDPLKYFYISGLDGKKFPREINTDKKTRYAQIVTGAKGHGKSTYCDFMASYAGFLDRKILIVNLDATAEDLGYEEPVADIRDVVKAGDINESRKQAKLERSLSYILKNPDWLFARLDKHTMAETNDYVLFDCPGEVDVVHRVKALNDFIELLASKNFRTGCVFIRDSHLALNGYDFIASCLTPMASYVNFKVPHISVMMKMDTLSKEEKEKLDVFMKANIPDILIYENCKETGKAPNDLREMSKTAAFLLKGQSSDPQEYFPLDISESKDLQRILSAMDRMLGRPKNTSLWKIGGSEPKKPADNKN